MLDKKISDLLIQQINMELYSAYLYLDMANYYEDESLNGFANWMFIQTQEERDHAMLFRTYLLDNDVRVTLGTIQGIDLEYKGHGDPFTLALEHERKVTASINNIYKEALDLHDYGTVQFLDWFVKEQVEEEKNATDNIKRYELFAHESRGLYNLDQEFATRVYSAPSIAA